MNRNDIEELERQSALIAKLIRLPQDSDVNPNTGIAGQFDRFLERQNIGTGPQHAGILPPTTTEVTEHILHPYFIQWCFFVSLPIDRIGPVHREWAKKFFKEETP